MNAHSRTVLLFALALFFVAPAQAKKPIASVSFAKGDVVLWLQGEYRPRLELFQQRDLGDATDQNGLPKDRLFLSHRARLSLGAQLFKQLTLFIQVQDVRIWGTETDTLGDFQADAFDLHQGWLQVQLFDVLFLKAGRMEFSYDNERLIGAVAWTQQARSFNGFQLRLEPGWWKLHLNYARLSDIGQPDAEHHLAMAWFQLHKLPFVKPSFYYILQSNPQAAKVVRHTVGTFLKGKASGFLYSAEFFLQLGNYELAGAQESLFAWMLAGSAGYQIPVPTRPTLVVWAELLSGNTNDANDKTLRAFDTLFATNHKFYGLADFFLNIPAHTKLRGLMDFGGGLRLWPVKKLLVRLDFHYFRLFAPLASGQGEGVQELGSEIDVVVKYVMFKGHFHLLAAYGVLIPQADQAFSALGKGNAVEHWLAIQAGLKF